jgi:CSLREA domain-containing protein
MRLNADALSDLVILKDGSSTPMVALTAPMATFTVNSTADTDDGAGTADPGGCRLREAINAANANAGADMINFNIGAGTPTINVGTGGWVCHQRATGDLDSQFIGSYITSTNEEAIR